MDENMVKIFLRFLSPNFFLAIIFKIGMRELSTVCSVRVHALPRKFD